MHSGNISCIRVTLSLAVWIKNVINCEQQIEWMWNITAKQGVSSLRAVSVLWHIWMRRQKVAIQHPQSGTDIILALTEPGLSQKTSKCASRGNGQWSASSTAKASTQLHIWGTSSVVSLQWHNSTTLADTGFGKVRSLSHIWPGCWTNMSRRCQAIVAR